MSKDHPELSRPNPALRRMIAWAGHVPGLWLCYRERLPRALWMPNAIAAGATLVAIAVVAYVMRDSPARIEWTVLTWLIGHVVWGTFLAWRLPPAQ